MSLLRCDPKGAQRTWNKAQGGLVQEPPAARRLSRKRRHALSQ